MRTLYDIVRGTFDQFKSEFTLTTVDIVDLDFNKSNEYNKTPIIDPSQYYIKVENQHISGRWITSIAIENIIHGEITKLRQNNHTIYNM